jgi:hypothetical protein
MRYFIPAHLANEIEKNPQKISLTKTDMRRHENWSTPITIFKIIYTIFSHIHIQPF